MPLKVVSLLAAALLTWSADAHAGEAEKVTVSFCLSQDPSPPAPLPASGARGERRPAPPGPLAPAPLPADRFAVPGRGESTS